jgi:hypothetical protein
MLPLFMSHPGMDILPVTNERWAGNLRHNGTDERGRLIVFFDAMENLMVVIGMEKIGYGEKKEDIMFPKESSGGSLACHHGVKRMDGVSPIGIESSLKTPSRYLDILLYLIKQYNF